MTPRPKRTDAAIVAQVAERLIPEVVRWLQENDDDINYDTNLEERERLKEELIEAMNGDYDGYRIARELDHCSWTPDAALVEILDSASTYAGSVLGKACEEWFAANKLVPYTRGAKVKCNTPADDPTSGKIGTIIDVKVDGRYSVNIPELGHKNPEDRLSSGTLGRILEHELLEVVQ